MSILRVNSITPYTGSLLTINGDIAITGNFTGSSIGNVGTRLTNLESETIALESFTSSFSTSVDSRLDVVEATASLHIPFSTSVNARLDSVQTYTASVSTSVGVLQSTASLHIPFSTSVDSRLDIVEATASLHIPFSTSVDSRFVGIEAATASLQVSTNALSSVTASYATTGSNVFLGNQTISGSTVITGNLNIFGSASFTTVTSSIILGGNTIQLNTFSPVVRFGGISVIDSGSSGLTGSLLWDSEKDKWIYANPSGGAYDSAMLISGPKNTSGIGNELGLVTNYIVKAVGDDHISSSQMQDDGVTVTIPYTASIGSIMGLGNPTVFSTSVDSRLDVVEATASLYIPFSTSVDSRLVSLATTGSNTFVGNQTVSGSLNVSSSILVNGSINANSLTGSINYNNLTNIPEGIVSGSSQITISSTTGYSDYSSSVATSISASSAAATAAATWTSLSGKPEGIVSGSSQITYSGITGIPTGIISSSNQLTSSYDDRYVLSGSITQTTWDNIASKPGGIVSGSSQITISSTTGYSDYSGSVATSISASAAAATAAATWASLSGKPEGIVSGSSQVNADSITNFDENVKAKLDADSVVSGSLLGLLPTGVVSGSSQVIGILDSLNTFSGSQLTQNSNLATITGSLISSASTAKTTNDSQDISITNLNSFSSSQLAHNSELATITGSLISSASTLTQRVAANEAVSGTFARTNSANIFSGNQTITGSLYVTQDLVVLGSSSIQNISSSTLNIGTNMVTVAVNNPSVRFGGLAVIDSGSAGGSGSFLYDSIQDEFIFIHKGNGINVTSSVVLMGPETVDNLGNETYLTANRLPKGLGTEHLADSTITDTGTLITLGSNTTITGTLIATGTTLVSGSSQITATSTTGFATGVKTQLDTNTVVSGSGQINVASTTGDIALGTRTSGNYVASMTAGTGITVGTATGEGSTPVITNTGVTSNVAGNAITVSGATGAVTINHADTSTAANLTASGRTYVSALTFDTYGHVTAYSTATETVTDTNTVTTNIAGTGISVSAGTGNSTITNTGVTSNVAGTGVTVSGATGAVTISIGQAVGTASNVQFNSLGVGKAASATTGRIEATQDIVAYSSSDRRFKENITPIQDALDKINQISGITFDWKAENKSEHGYEGNDVGVIAQEIEGVLPQLVQTRENGYKAVKYEKLVALLIEGIKELHNEINLLKNK